MLVKVVVVVIIAMVVMVVMVVMVIMVIMIILVIGIFSCQPEPHLKFSIGSCYKENLNGFAHGAPDLGSLFEKVPPKEPGTVPLTLVMPAEVSTPGAMLC